MPDRDLHAIDHDRFIFSDYFCKPRDKVKCAHLNINSVRHKFELSVHALHKCFIDTLLLQETKLDSSFPAGHFHIDNFKVHGKDFTSRSGDAVTW